MNDENMEKDRDARRNELWKLYYQRDKEFEAAKGKRTLLTFLLFAAAYFLLFTAIRKPQELLAVVAYLLASLFFSGIHFLVNVTVFGYLCDKGRTEAEILARIKKQISELEGPDTYL